MSKTHKVFKVLITNGYGSKKELCDAVGTASYNEMLRNGFISERKLEGTKDKEWKAEESAYTKANFLKILPGKDCRLPSTPKTRLYQKQDLLIQLLGYFQIL